MRDTMIFYRSFYEAIKHLPSETQAEIYNAIFSYGLDFVEPELKGISLTIWTLIKPQLDANIKRFENGKKPKFKQSESKVEAKDKQDESETLTNNNNNNNNNVNNNKNVLLKKETKNKKSLEERKKDFQCLLVDEMREQNLDKNIVKEFYEYWVEPNQSKSKMRYEMEKVFDIKRRLNTWIKNNDKFNTSKNGKSSETRTDGQNNAVEQFRQRIVSSVNK
jgi:hypothetical protein